LRILVERRTHILEAMQATDSPVPPGSLTQR
jgi:hypothetical protein